MKDIILIKDVNGLYQAIPIVNIVRIEAYSGSLPHDFHLLGMDFAALLELRVQALKRMPFEQALTVENIRVAFGCMHEAEEETRPKPTKRTE